MEATVEKKMNEDSTQEALVQSLMNALHRYPRHHPAVTPVDLGNGELYLMTGEAEGVTVKVVCRGRPVR